MTADKPIEFWEAAAAFLLSERDRHFDDIKAINHKLKLIQKHHGVDVALLDAAEFLTEAGIVGDA